MENSIRHEGKVESIEGRHIRVKIVQNSACSACKVASHCNAADSKEKVIDVYGAPSRTIQVGDDVVVATSGKTAGRALLLGFGLPLALMLTVLVAILASGQDEGLSALAAIGVLIPYYIGVWAFRDRIASSVSFTIE